MKNSENVINQTNLSFQTLELKNKLNWPVTDETRWKLTQQLRLKTTMLIQAQKDVINNLMKDDWTRKIYKNM